VTPPDTHSSNRTRPRLIIAAAGVLVVAIISGLAASAVAERATTLGKTKRTPNPACPDKKRTPENECQITGQVTGYQRSVAGKSNLFKAKRNGKIVAWGVDLSRPSKSERNIFGRAAATDEFGKNPTAGIAILRKKDNRRFKLLRHSPILKVQSFYGENPTFTLRDPLRIRKGQIVALTTATWLPAFAFRGQGRDTVWVGSRPRKDCEIPSSVPQDKQLEYFFAHTRPHRKVGTERKYQCTYSQARLLYWAYLAPGGN
jgi:hypothetical protein